MNKLFLNKNFKYIAIILLIAIFFIADRYLKFLALALDKTKSQPLVGDFLSFTFVKNYYISFSIPLPPKLILLFSFLSLILLIFIIILSIKKNKRIGFEGIWFLLVFMGAISNLIDRLSFGYVIDYFKIAQFSVFNLADLMISLGALFLIINYSKNKTVIGKN